MGPWLYRKVVATVILGALSGPPAFGQVTLPSQKLPPIAPSAPSQPEGGTQQTPPEQITRKVECPAQVSVGAVRDVRPWTIPTATGRYAGVRLETRSLGGQPFFSAVCVYSAFNGEVSIERIMGQTNVLRDCRTFARQGSTGGVACR